MLNQTDLSQLWQIHGALQRLAVETAVVVGMVKSANVFTLNVVGNGSGIDAKVGAFKMIYARVGRLDEKGDLGQAVQTGAWVPQQWIDYAQIQWDALVDLQHEAGSDAFRFAAVWGEAVVPTLATVKQKAADTYDGAKESFLPVLVLCVVGLIALAVIKVS